MTKTKTPKRAADMRWHVYIPRPIDFELRCTDDPELAATIAEGEGGWAVEFEDRKPVKPNEAEFALDWARAQSALMAEDRIVQPEDLLLCQASWTLRFVPTSLDVMRTLGLLEGAMGKDYVLNRAAWAEFHRQRAARPDYVEGQLP